MIEVVIRLNSEATALNSICLIELFNALNQADQTRIIDLTKDLLSNQSQGSSAQEKAY